ncbi:hypothetical protein D1007_27750 [Hordeum vulgare]|nr:hypothetical protein D1007_27750 [Hordeum vulgare]
MDSGEVVDAEEEVTKGDMQREGRREVKHRGERRPEYRRRLAEKILAARNRKDKEQFLEAFRNGSNPTDDDIIYGARRRANFRPFQVTRQRDDAFDLVLLASAEAAGYFLFFDPALETTVEAMVALIEVWGVAIDLVALTEAADGFMALTAFREAVSGPEATTAEHGLGGAESAR